MLELEPLSQRDVEALIAASGAGPLPARARRGDRARSEGNPFFARELLAAAARGETALPPVLRDALLGHIAVLGADAAAVLRVAAVAGRDVSYGLLASVLPFGELQLAGALRDAVEHDVLVADQAASAFRFRHALFAEAVHGTLLPGEREVLHERLARTLTDCPAAPRPPRRPLHWAAAGRPVEALEASLRAARAAEAVSGLTEALRHVERVLELWDQVPAAEQVSGVALPSVLAWAAELAAVDVERGGDAGRLGGAAAVPDRRRAREPGRAADAAARGRRAGVAALGERAPARGGRRPGAAIVADDDFHRVLTAGCGNQHLLAALDPVRHALLRYERVYMREPVRIERSVAQHEGIIEALARGDHADAAQRVRENLSGGLPDLREVLEA